jgi:hypothetical protein
MVYRDEKATGDSMGGLIKQAWRQARRAVVFVAGSSVLIAGRS